jgi:hypothetical protein
MVSFEQSFQNFCSELRDSTYKVYTSKCDIFRNKCGKYKKEKVIGEPDCLARRALIRARQAHASAPVLLELGSGVRSRLGRRSGYDRHGCRTLFSSRYAFNVRQTVPFTLTRPQLELG